MVLQLSVLCSRMILIHACARIAASIYLPFVITQLDFNSCMREDCNHLQRFYLYARPYFDSCMREDCNKPGVSGGRSLLYFDSCMREDCNGIGWYCDGKDKF